METIGFKGNSRKGHTLFLLERRKAQFAAAAADAGAAAATTTAMATGIYGV